MADLDDDAITVTLPPDEDGGAVITKVEGEKPVVQQDDPISDLKGQFETLKGQLGQTTQRLVGAERELETTRQQLETTKKEATSSQLDTDMSGIQAAVSLKSFRILGSALSGPPDSSSGKVQLVCTSFSRRV